MSKMEFKVKTETEALEKIANAPLEHHWGCDQILIDGCHFAMSDVQDYAKATLKNQPQLTIPKSIADELDENYNNNHSLAWFDSPLSQNILNWYDENHNNWNIANIYINSKSLGVDLVKVVEG